LTVPTNATSATKANCSEHQSGAGHETGADQEQGPQVVARRDRSDGQRQQRGAEQRGGGDDPNLHRVVADRGQIGRQDDDGKTIAKAAHPARGVEQRDAGGRGHAKPDLHVWRTDIPPTALGPARGRKCSAWANALMRPGDCDQARQRVNAAKRDRSQ
jgi:hypothetical protein